MSGKRDTKVPKRFVVHVMKALTIDFIVLECSAELALFDRHEPHADIGDRPSVRIACGGKG